MGNAILMSMKHLRGIEIFVKAVEAGSIAEAARQLRITAAGASQAIARLEAALGTRLLNRTTRSLALTDGGQVYFERVRDLAEQLDSAHAALDEVRGQPQGTLKVTCSSAFGRTIITPLLPSFLAAHPRVSMELVLTDDAVDHVKQAVDVSIRFREQLEPRLVARRLADVPLVFCASPAYLARAGRPHRPEELKDHDCLVFRVPSDGLVLRWAFVRDGVRFEPPVRSTFACNDIGGLAAMAVAGAGITRLGSFIAHDLIAAGQLEPLFLRGHGRSTVAIAEPLEFYACTLDRRNTPLKARRFVEHLVTQLTDHPLLRPLHWPLPREDASLPRKARRPASRTL